MFFICTRWLGRNIDFRAFLLFPPLILFPPATSLFIPRVLFSIHTFFFASFPFISTRTFFLCSLTTSFSIGGFFLLENPRLILDLRREIGYSLALHPNISMYILHTIQYISSGFEKENLSNNQELLSLLIISLILVTLMFYSGVIS